MERLPNPVLLTAGFRIPEIMAKLVSVMHKRKKGSLRFFLRQPNLSQVISGVSGIVSQ